MTSWELHNWHSVWVLFSILKNNHAEIFVLLVGNLLNQTFKSDAWVSRVRTGKKAWNLRITTQSLPYWKTAHLPLHLILECKSQESNMWITCRRNRKYIQRLLQVTETRWKFEYSQRDMLEKVNWFHFLWSLKVNDVYRKCQFVSSWIIHFVYSWAWMGRIGWVCKDVKHKVSCF